MDERYEREQEQAAAQEAGAIGGPVPDGETKDPAMRPVQEAGGGVAEGFEDAEQELIDAAGDTVGEGGRPIALRDAPDPEPEGALVTAEAGEADEIVPSSSDRIREGDA